MLESYFIPVYLLLKFVNVWEKYILSEHIIIYYLCGILSNFYHLNFTRSYFILDQEFTVRNLLHDIMYKQFEGFVEFI